MIQNSASYRVELGFILGNETKRTAKLTKPFLDWTNQDGFAIGSKPVQVVESLIDHSVGYEKDKLVLGRIYMILLFLMRF